MTSNVQMVFWGEVLDGFHADDVKRRFAEAFRLDDDRLRELFCGARTVIKRSLEPAVARTYAEKLARLGLRVDFEPSDSLPPTEFTPLPVLPEVPQPLVHPPPPWVAPPASARPPRPTPVTALVSARGAMVAAECRTCGERQSKRRVCGVCATDVAMDASTRPRASSDEARDARQSRPQAQSVAVFGLSCEGRMGRLKFATSNLAWLALFYLPLTMALQEPTPWRLSALAAAAVLLVFFGMRLAVLRCHDGNQSGWWSALLWLPAVNLVVAAMLVCGAGTRGRNAHGAEPPQAHWWELAAAALGAVLLLTLTAAQVMQTLA